MMKRKNSGNYITISTVGNETCKAFLPDPLPPYPDLEIDEVLQESMDQALLALGRLDSLSTLLPDTSLFLYMYIKKEAVLSSQIEGTQSSLSDLLLFENENKPGVPIDDVQEVSNYVSVLNYGLKRIREDFPISLRLIREIHEKLLFKGRGKDKDPGKFRKSQNWIGGTRPGNATYVPPPPEKVIECMGYLEKFIHDQPAKTPIIIKAALMHAQFETIHPFLDGNGRLGRLLVTLLLCSEGILKEPLLYLSLYLKTHRDTYYDLLQDIRINGDWEKWIKFFTDGVQEIATQAVETATRLKKLIEDNNKVINKLGKSAGSAIRIHLAFQQKPIASISMISDITELSVPTVISTIKKLESENIIKEITGSKRARLFAYDQYVQIINEGTIV